MPNALDLVYIRRGESFAARKYREQSTPPQWHYNLEYSIHLTATLGRVSIGDYVGRFKSRQLFLTGPGLPQKWISDGPQGDATTPQRFVIHLPKIFVQTSVENAPELLGLSNIMIKCRRGLLFDDATQEKAAPVIEALMNATGATRLGHLYKILAILGQARRPEVLASFSYQLDDNDIQQDALQRVIEFIRNNLTDEIGEDEISGLIGMSVSSFSRSFKRHTGMTFKRFKKKLKIELSCLMLESEDDMKVSDISKEVGFTSTSNFNRDFFRYNGTTPSQFRASSKSTAKP